MIDIINYHNAEEAAIGVFCMLIALRLAQRFKQTSDVIFFMVAEGFLILALSSVVHLAGHFLGEIQALLYGSLLGYTVGFSSMLAAPVTARESGPGKYVPIVAFVILSVVFAFNALIVDFFKTRFSLWMPVAFLSSLMTIIYLSEYLRVRDRHTGLVTTGFCLVAVSSVFLFFPADIRSLTWTVGHILRPFGFLLLLLGYAVRWK